MKRPLPPKFCVAARKLLNWTQADLALKSGVSLRTIYRYEAGETRSRKASVNIYGAFTRAKIQFFAAGDDEDDVVIGLRHEPKFPHKEIKLL